MLLEKIQLEPGEEVIKTVRKHWFVISAELFGFAIMIISPFLIIFSFLTFKGDLLNMQIDFSDYTALIAFGIVTWTIFTLMVAFATWTHFYLDLWIITDRRIILVDHIHFFNRNVAIFRLERLQDIEFTVKGIIPTLLDFGTIKAQTAGSLESNFKSNGLPDPRELQATIQKATDARLAAIHNNPDLA